MGINSVRPKVPDSGERNHLFPDWRQRLHATMGPKGGGHLNFRRVSVVLPDRVIPSADVTVEKGRIAQINIRRATQLHFNPANCETLLVPGLIDAQNNGGFGIDLTGDTPMDGTKLLTWAEKNLRGGVTSILATYITSPIADLRKALAHHDKLLFTPGKYYPNVAAFLEGPFLCEEKRGTHKSELLQKPSIQLLMEIVEGNLGRINMMAIAPELSGAGAVIDKMQSLDIKPTFAHSACTYAQTHVYFTCGTASLMPMITHLFNAMSQDYRHPGLADAALAREHKGIKIGLIADGYHVSRERILDVIDLLGSRNRLDDLVLVTDANSGQGMPDGYRGTIGGTPYKVSKGRAVNNEGNLAGSVLTLPRAIENIWNWTEGKLPFHTLMNMVTYNPAVAMRIHRNVGAIQLDQMADLLVVETTEDRKGHFRFRIRNIYRNGYCVKGPTDEFGDGR